MRYLTVGNTEIEMSDEVAEALLASDTIYPCGDMHDLHLSPDHSFTLSEVEMLLNPYPEP